MTPVRNQHILCSNIASMRQHCARLQRRKRLPPLIGGVALALLFCVSPFSVAGQNPTPPDGVAVGAQYDSTHVYVAPADLDTFVNSFIATFSGQASKRSVTNVLPVPSSTEFQYVWTSMGTLSVFAYQTPVPYPFGQERTGYLVTDMDQAIHDARSAGAEVIVDPFKDPIGMDAVIQWPGGLKMQLYWHSTPPQYAPLATIPENRVYVSSDRADEFVKDFVSFAHGQIVADDKHADAAEIACPGETYRRILLRSLFGNMQVLVTNGHLPYPFGHEITGYEVTDITATLAKAKLANARILWGPHTTKDRTTAILEFPGGYIAELHSPK